MSGIREGRWLCKHCGSECRGRDEECNGLDGKSGCGAARASGTRFYLPENSPYVTDKTLLTDAKSGQDWNCSHCDGANKGSNDGYWVKSCAHCGSARDNEDAVTPVRYHGISDVLKSAPEATRIEREDLLAATRSRRQRRVAQQNGPGEQFSKSDRNFSLWAILAIPIMLFAVWMAWSFFTARHEVVHQVASHNWERSITHDEFRTLTQDGWNPPSDARIVRSEVKIRSYRDVLDHYETKTRQLSREVASGSESYHCGTTDLGNGYFQDKTCSRTIYRTENYTETYKDPVYREEPVWDTWYDWKVDRWVHDEIYHSRGTGLERHWANTPALHDKLRETGRAERLWLDLVSAEHGDRSMDLPEPLWLEIKDGETLISVTNWAGQILESKTGTGKVLALPR